MTICPHLKLSNLLFIVTFLLLVSCTAKTIIQDSKSIPMEKWGKNNTVALTIPVTDTIGVYDVYITLRVRENYPYKNLYLFVTSYAPSGAFVTDTLGYDLFDNFEEELGKWSSGMGDYRLPFMQQAVFLENGKYRFEIGHGMRTDELLGVIDIGICIEKPD